MVTHNWTNNYCVSVNHVLKQAIDWQSKPLVPLVKTLQDIADGQFKELRSAMVGTGEFRLTESHKQFQLSKTGLVNKMNSQRENALKKFRNYDMTLKNIMITTYGQSEIMAPRTHGKKLNQDKRKINARTMTYKKRKVQRAEPTSP